MFVLPNLRAGGAERVFSFISQNLDTSIFECELLIIGRNEDVAYDVSKVKCTYLGKNRVFHAIPALIKYIHTVNADVVLSSVEHLNIVMGLISPLFPKTKFLIRVASVISKMRMYTTKNHLQMLLPKLSYRLVNGVICQSQDMASDFVQLYPNTKYKIEVIGNPVTLDTNKRAPMTQSRRREYITVGRLSPEKGHSRLLSVLGKLKSDFHYTIVGDGPERLAIEQKIKRLDLINKITLIPFTNEVSKYLHKSNYFLQGSYSEGFPNAILESCSQGIPVVAFNAPGGTREIIEPMINGIMVNDEASFVEFLENTTLIWDRKLIQDSVLKKFGKHKIIERYENLILTTSKRLNLF
ncbi:MAG: glycosyltransferase [Bacteroidota bacterium]